MAVHWITVEDAAELLRVTGLPRNPRTIRRYCTRGDLECNKTENALHQPQYFISKASVETYIEQQWTLLAGRPGLSGQVQTAPDTEVREDDHSNSNSVGDAGAVEFGHDRTGPDRPTPVRSSRNGELVEQLETRLKDKDVEIAFLRGELLHRRTTDTALHDVIAAFRANAEAQRLAAGPGSAGQVMHAQKPAQPTGSQQVVHEVDDFPPQGLAA